MGYNWDVAYKQFLINLEEEEEERLYLLRIARDSAQTLINIFW